MAFFAFFLSADLLLTLSVALFAANGYADAGGKLCRVASIAAGVFVLFNR